MILQEAHIRQKTEKTKFLDINRSEYTFNIRLYFFVEVLLYVHKKACYARNVRLVYQVISRVLLITIRDSLGKFPKKYGKNKRPD